METVAYYVAMFDRGENGELVASEAQERQSAGAAETASRQVAETVAGAVAFSRTGDPSNGEFGEGVVLPFFSPFQVAPASDRRVECGLPPVAAPAGANVAN